MDTRLSPRDNTNGGPGRGVHTWNERFHKGRHTSGERPRLLRGGEGIRKLPDKTIEMGFGGRYSKYQKLIYIIVVSIIPAVFFLIGGSIESQDFHVVALLSLGLLFLFVKEIEYLEVLRETLEIIFLFFILNSLSSLIKLNYLFPFDRLILVAAIGLYIFAIKKESPKDYYIAKGEFKSAVLLLSAAIAIISIGALILWFNSQAENPYEKFLPDFPATVLVVGGIFFALFNALYEEVFFRGVLLGVISGKISVFAALILQSLWFGLFHYSVGFPSGAFGFGLTFLFGLSVGFVLVKSRGILLPIIIHALADASISILVILRSRG
ncbi:MAG: CPBP family intramembrane glutamic endopeptidase [bacterium]